MIRLRSADPRDAPEIFHGYRGVVDTGGFDAIYDDWVRLKETPSFRAAHVQDVREAMDPRASIMRGVGTVLTQPAAVRSAPSSTQSWPSSASRASR